MITRGWCGPCHQRCGLLIDIQGGRAIRVKGDRRHPISKGFTCERGRTILDHLYHKDRVNFPLERVGSRGSGHFKTIGWPEALDGIAERLEALRARFGPETLAFAHGTYRTYGWPVKRFFNLFGSPNITGAQYICRCPSWTVEWATLGGPVFPDLERTNLIVLFGAHPKDSCPHPFFSGLVHAKKRGAKLIVVDPMQNEEARMADIWLPIRPGSDVAVMLLWIRMIVEEGLYDKGFVEGFTHGFERLKDHVLSLAPQSLAKATGLSLDDILKAGRLYATTRPSVIPWGLGIDRQGLNAQQAQRARLILQTLMGNLDVPGGELLGRSGLGVISDYEMELNHTLSPEQRKKQLGSDLFPLMAYPGYGRIEEAALSCPKSYALPPVAEFGASAHPYSVFKAIEEGNPYPVRALFSQASNPIMTLADPKRIARALKDLDLLVVMDYYITPTAQMADFILPAAGTLERADIQDFHGFAPFVIPNPKAIEPLYERRDDYFLWKELGRRLGPKEAWPWETMEEALDFRLAPEGLGFSSLLERGALFGRPAFRKYQTLGFATPTKKAELFSSIFEGLGLEPLPVYRPPKTPPNDDFPLWLLTGTRFMPMYHSELRQIYKVRQRHPDPLVAINPKTAEAYGLKQGEWVLIENPFGGARFRVWVTDNVQPGMVHAEHGWWFPEKPPGWPQLSGAFLSNCNTLTTDAPGFVSPEIGSWPLSALNCKIQKINEGVPA